MHVKSPEVTPKHHKIPQNAIKTTKHRKNHHIHVDVKLPQLPRNTANIIKHRKTLQNICECMWNGPKILQNTTKYVSAQINRTVLNFCYKNSVLRCSVLFCGNFGNLTSSDMYVVVFAMFCGFYGILWCSGVTSGDFACIRVTFVAFWGVLWYFLVFRQTATVEQR